MLCVGGGGGGGGSKSISHGVLSCSTSISANVSDRVGSMASGVKSMSDTCPGVNVPLKNKKTEVSLKSYHKKNLCCHLCLQQNRPLLKNNKTNEKT